MNRLPSWPRHCLFQQQCVKWFARAYAKQRAEDQEKWDRRHGK